MRRREAEQKILIQYQRTADRLMNKAAELQVEATDRDRAAGTTARRLAAELDAGTNTERADEAGSVG